MKFDLKELQKVTILYVEDEDIIRNQTLSVFENVFKKTYLAKDGAEGLEIFRNHQDKIDVVISDINMPELSGLDMAEEIHAIIKNIPIILTTAYTEEEYLLKSLELNIYKYVTKPLKIQELTINILEAAKQYTKERNLTKKAKLLANKQIIAQKEVSQLQENVSLSQREIHVQQDIINNFVSHLKLDKNGIIKQISNKCSTIYGYKKDEIINENITTLCENNSLVQKKLLEAVREKKVITFNDTFNTKDNKKLKLFCKLYPLYETSDGMVSGYNLYQDTFLG